jgi:hypothetical protein
VERKRVVACGNRCVRRENGCAPDLLQGGFERPPLLTQVADSLQGRESGVAFIQVEHARLGTNRFKSANASDSKQNLLLNPGFAVAAVEARRQVAVPWRVLLEIGIEQVEADPAETHAPHGHQHRAIAQRNRCHTRAAFGCQRRLDGNVGPVQLLVNLPLPSVGRDLLMEVALRIHESDADERHAEVACFLTVVPREHAKPASINGQ